MLAVRPAHECLNVESFIVGHGSNWHDMECPRDKKLMESLIAFLLAVPVVAVDFNPLIEIAASRSYVFRLAGLIRDQGVNGCYTITFIFLPGAPSQFPGSGRRWEIQRFYPFPP